MSDLFDLLDGFVTQGKLEEVERHARAALADANAEDAGDLWRYVAWSQFEQGRLKEALTSARRASDGLYEAKALFHQWDLPGAVQALSRFEGAGEDAAEAAWYRGVLCEFRGDPAEPHFAEAHRLAPELFALPARLTDEEVDGVIRSAIAALPPVLRKAVDETVIEVCNLPKPHPDVDPLSMGLYHGMSRIERDLEVSGLPPRILIYRLNIERFAADRETAIDELRITLLHEVGHHLGFDEKGVADLGLE